jgi:hypothetical protein
MRPRADVHEDDGTCDETLAQRETRVNGDRPDFSGREYEGARNAKGPP